MRHQRRGLELKVELSTSDVARLASKRPCSGLTAAPPVRTKIHSVYFDTPGHHLRAAGISLRLTRESGGWLQTVMADDGGSFNPIETEAAVDGEEPDIGMIGDKKLRRAVRKAAKGYSLRPVLEAAVQRMTRSLKVDGSEVELVVDEGEAPRGGTGKRRGEAGLELRSGSAAGLLRAAETLLAGRELKSISLSEAGRDHRQARDEDGTGARPVMAGKLHLRRKSTCARAFSAILASTARQTIANRQAVLETDDPEAAHQLRVGLRRLRSALRALRPLVGARSLREFEHSARDVARCVGTLRDSDVLIGSLHGPVMTVAPDKKGLAELSEALARHRRLKRDEVRSVLRGAAWSRLELCLVLWPHMLEEVSTLSQPIRSYARKALRKRWRKTTKYGRELDQLSPEQRHEMRKRLKELRYSAEFFASLFQERDTRRFIKQLKVLQDIFGFMNDVRIIAPQLHTVAEQHRASREAAACAGYVTGRNDAEAVHVWRRAGRAWRKLEASPRFWRK